MADQIEGNTSGDMLLTPDLSNYLENIVGQILDETIQDIAKVGTPDVAKDDAPNVDQDEVPMDDEDEASQDNQIEMVNGNNEVAFRGEVLEDGQDEVPRIDQEEAPRIDEEEAPKIDQEEAPKIDQEEAPKIDQEEAPRIDEEEAPRIDLEDAPKIDEENTPNIDQNGTSKMDQDEASESDQEEVHKEDEDVVTEGPNECEGSLEYIVEQILDKKIETDGTVKYLVKWEGYPSSENTWEPIGNLMECEKAMRVYEIARAQKLAKKHGNNANGSGKTHTNGHKDYKVADIRGLTEVQNERYFLVSLEDSSEQVFIRASLANRLFPSKVIDFYMKHIQWKQKPSSS